jgi:O-antigen/teichoic acid export membrane protein
MSSIFRQLLPGRVVQSTSVYFIGEILTRIVPFLLMPVLTRYLSPEHYGLFGVFQVLFGIAGPVIHFGVSGAVSRFYFDRDDKDFSFPVFIANCLYITSAAALIVGLLTVIFAVPLGHLASFPPEWLWTIVVVAFGNSVGMVLLGLWTVRQQAQAFISFVFIRTLINFGLATILVVYFHFGWEGPVLAQVITICAFAVIAVLILAYKGWIKLGWNTRYAVEAVKFGAPLIPHAIGFMVIALIDRLFIAHYNGLRDAGIYTVSYQIALVIQTATDSFNRAWVPWLYEKLKQEKYSVLRKIVKVTYLYNAAVLISAVLLGISAPLILSFFVGNKYTEASRYVLLLALSFAFEGMYKMVTNYIFFSKKTYLLAYITGGTALGNIGLNFWLIPRYGIMGAAVATVVSYFASFIVTWIVAARCYRLPWGLKPDPGEQAAC